MADVTPRAQVPERCAVFFHHRWSVPLLASLCASGEASFTDLLDRLGVSRAPLIETLAALDEWGLVMQGSRRGRFVFYRLTPRGAAVAPACAALTEAVHSAGLFRIALHKWSMPALAAMGGGADRFGLLRAALPGISPRALSRALRELRDAGMVEPEPGVPGGYRLTGPAPDLARLTAAMFDAHERARAGLPGYPPPAIASRPSSSQLPSP